MEQKSEEQPEMIPPEHKFIEVCHNEDFPISEKEFNKETIINKYYFNQIKRYYIYEINFSKDSRLKYIDRNPFSSLNLYSINLPVHLEILPSRSLEGCFYLSHIGFTKDESGCNYLKFIVDDVFKDTKIQSITLPEFIEEIGSNCFPKCLNQIEFEKGAPFLRKIGDFAFSNTQIKSFNIPLNFGTFVTSKNCFYKCKNLDTINFDHYHKDKANANDDELNQIKENEERMNRKRKFKEQIQNFSIKDENLSENDDENLYNITQDIAKSLLLSQIQIKNISVSNSNLNNFYFYNTPKLLSITIKENDKVGFIKKQGCLYTSDKKKLIVAERNIENVKISSKCQIISNYAFNVKSLEKVEFKKNSELQEISFFAFYESNIKQIDIPNSVDYIDYAAFYKCVNLESANIPASLFIIDFFTFSYTKITEILIPKSIVKIKYGCFYNCTNLVNVLFEKDSNLIEIDDFAFSLTKIENISFPNKVKRIGNYCFFDCKNLKEIELLSDISEIGYKCFEGTQINQTQIDQILQKVDFSKSKQKEKNCFYEQKNNKITYFVHPKIVSNITQIYIPSKVEEIGFHAFFDCQSLTKVEIIDIENSKLRKISEGAFFNCFNLIQFNLPNKVYYFGPFCFQNCSKYEHHLNVRNDKFTMVGKNAFENSSIIEFNSKSEEILIDDCAFSNCKYLTKISIDSSKKCELGNSVFLNCCSLNVVEISPDVLNIKIGESCFMNSAINSFSIPNSLQIIPKYCFIFCQNLTKVNIDENSKLTQFQTKAFHKSGIEKIFIPSKTKIIGKCCFKMCQNLRELNLSIDLEKCVFEEKAFYMTGIENLSLLGVKTKIQYACFAKCSKLSKLEILGCFNEIGDEAFKSSGIEEITLYLLSLNSIGNFSFQNCKNLKKIAFYDDNYSYTNDEELSIKIFSTSFYEDYNLKYVDFNSQISIFNNDNPKYFIKIPKGKITDENVINELFTSNKPIIQPALYCDSFDSIQINGEKLGKFNFNIKFNEVFKYEIQRNFQKIECIEGGYYSNFRKKLINCCSSIDSLVILKETIVIKSNALRFSNLKKIDFENGSQLQTIENFAFAYLQIEEITLPDTVTLIGDSAFYGCKLLKHVNITLKSQLEKIGKSAFENSGIEGFLFPSSLTTIDDFAFFDCFKLKTVHNCSKQISFGIKSFSHSSIENIKFSPKTIFCESSFEGCMNIKNIEFCEPPEEIIIKTDSFASSGLESLEIENNVEIHKSAFSFCSKLKNVVLAGDNIKCLGNPFIFTDIESLILNLKAQIVLSLSDIFNGIEKSNIKNLTFSLSNNILHDHKHVLNFYVKDNCYFCGDNSHSQLYYVDLIDNVSLYENNPQTTINKNEILIVPSSISYLCFSYMPHIKKIQFPQNCIVDDIGFSGFYSYFNLVEITIPKLVKKIETKLFENCYYLKEVSFENGSQLDEIGEFAFSNTRVEKVILPDTVKIIKKAAFAYNKHLKEVSFHGETIEKEAFLQTGLVMFTLSNNTKTIGSGAFQYCKELKKFDVDIENSKLFEIGKYAFAESSIMQINIPREIEIINEFTFNCCSLLEEVKFAENSQLHTIDHYSFAGNLKLKRINIPKSIVALSYRSFINTPLLESIMIESNKNFVVMDNNEIYSKLNHGLIFVPRNLKQYKIKEKCSIIHSGAFCGPNLEKVSFADNSLICIEECSFAHSTSLKEISIPNSIQRIESNAFINCQNLEIVKFMPGCQLKEIPKYCFAFSGLKEINLPSSIEIIDQSSFYFCQNLEKINLHETKLKYIFDSAFVGTNIKEIIFPTTTVFIDNHSFEETKSLKIVDFTQLNLVSNFKPPNKHLRFNKYKNKYNELLNMNNNECFVHESSFCNSSVKIFKFKQSQYKWFNFFDKCIKIEEYIVNEDLHLYLNKLPSKSTLRSSYEIAKIDCKNEEKFVPFRYLNTSRLEKIFIGDDIKIKNIPNCLFAFSCLEEILIPSSVKVIKSSAFKDCYNLEKVTFSKNSSLKKIERFAFYCCRKLKTFTIPDHCEKISMKSFSFTGLTKIEIPSTVIKIEYMAFYNCKDLNQIILNEGLNIIDELSFANNYSLESIDLPNSLTTINSYAFLDCSNLKQVNTKEGTLLNFIKKGAFENTKIEELKFNPSIQFSLEQQNAPRLNRIEFHKGPLLYFKKNDDGILFTSYHFIELYFAPKNLEKLIVDKSCAFFYKSSLKEMANLKTIEFRNDSTFSFNDAFPEKKYNNIKKLRFLGISYNFEQKNPFVNFKSLEIVEFCEHADIFSLPVFSSCKKLRKIVIPSSCKEIHERAFKDCINLESVKFGSKSRVLKFEMEAFYNCSSLVSFVIPPLVTMISKGAFMNCSKLKRVEFERKNNNNSKKESTSFADDLCIGPNAFKNCTSLEFLVVPPRCCHIQSAAFMNCINLRSIKINSDCISTISYRAFYNCKSLTYFEYKCELLQTSYFSIGAESFMNCSSLKEIVIEEILKFKPKFTFDLPPYKINTNHKVHKKAFCNCKELKRVRLFILDLDKIGEKAFMNCSSLKSLEINSLYINFILNKNMDSSAYFGVPDDFQIKLFNREKIVKVFKDLIGKKADKLEQKNIIEEEVMNDN